MHHINIYGMNSTAQHFCVLYEDDRHWNVSIFQNTTPSALFHSFDFLLFASPHFYIMIGELELEQTDDFTKKCQDSVYVKGGYQNIA